MKKRIKLFAAVVTVLALSGCGGSPFPLMGLVYIEGKAPYHAVEGATGNKTGKACATSVLGLVATGDASIATAMKDGGLSTVTAVDYSSKHILGIWAEFCTMVTGK